MSLDIKLHKVDLPDQIKFSDKIAIDCEFMGLNVERDRLCLVQISSGNDDAHIIQLDKEKYNAPNLKKILLDKKINEYGGIKEIIHMGSGGMHKFPFGFVVGCIYYKRNYKGPIEYTRMYAKDKNGESTLEEFM